MEIPRKFVSRSKIGEPITYRYEGEDETNRPYTHLLRSDDGDTITVEDEWFNQRKITPLRSLGVELIATEEGR